MEFIHTADAPDAIGPYSQAVVSDGWVFCSGQIALDPVSGVVMGETAAEQARQVLRNLSAVLDEAGPGLAGVVKTTIYLTDLETFGAVNTVYGSFFENEPPARATVEVSRLPKGALVEIDGIAVIDE